MTCQKHSGFEARIDILEKNLEEMRKDIKEMSAKLNKYGGGIAILAAIPIIIKLVEIFTPVAKAIGN